MSARSRKKQKHLATMFAVLGAMSLVLAVFVLAASFLIGDARIGGNWRLISAVLAALAAVSWLARAAISHQLNQRKATRKGGVLLLVLALTAALAVISAALVSLMHLQAAAATRRWQKEMLRVTAAARLRTAAADLAKMLAEGMVDASTNILEEVTPDGSGLITRFDDLNRRFDLNNLAARNIPETARHPEDILADLLTLCGDFEPLARVEALRDWIDEDDQGNYESPIYEQANPPYRCANTFLRSWEEILAVKGFSREYFAPRQRAVPPEAFQADPREAICIIPLPRVSPVPININTAPRPVLSAVLGLNVPGLVERVIAARCLQPYQKLEPVRVLAGDDLFSRISPYLTVRSSFFQVTTHASREQCSVSVSALIQIQEDGIRILRWQES